MSSRWVSTSTLPSTPTGACSVIANKQQRRRPSASTSHLHMTFEVSSSPAIADSEQPSKITSITATTEQLIDSILDECLRYSARRPIMRQFDPASRFIWRQWRGTVVAETWKSAAKHAIWAVAVFFLFQKYPRCTVGVLDGFHRVWGELLAVTTFTLTFFVNESYNCWRNCLSICYNLQGRMNDFSMALAGCAKRVEPSETCDPNAVETTSKFTPAARKILMIISRYIRVFNILSYASFTRSHRPLLTPQGMRRMVNRGLLTEKEHSILINSRVSATARHNEVLMWMFRTAMDARNSGHFDGGFGFEQNTLLRVQEIRAQGNYMECILQGRMPVGYINFVQVLVDTISWMYPIMAFSSGQSLQMGVVGVVVLTFSYQGLFDLAKRFLDPFRNDFRNAHDPIRVDTLIAETNAGSRRWMFGLEEMPIPLKVIQDGGTDLDFFNLPDEGYTVEEAAQKTKAEEMENAAAMSLSQIPAIADEIKFEDEQQVLEEEFEETQAIMSAPPGYTFVPGLDDVEAEDECTMSDTDESLQPCEEEKDNDEGDQPPSQVFDQFLETATEEYEEAIREEG
eukprot:CAMPEP_0172314520 /NCGR_PEP_ID=MMETSP1058-20130122/22741_1 /TAXON_ID=83371 /ORGANISM="Detonula confervacea, Strain CCMP 353" /LENGTH=568 /DNA_ID=CAMNT_0013028411 /DNA_START=254 /DNA_END=1960 /DNA_ORIENTATION=-